MCIRGHRVRPENMTGSEQKNGPHHFACIINLKNCIGGRFGRRIYGGVSRDGRALLWP